MILGSHNSWTFLPPTKWWMKLLSFISKCQEISIGDQYDYGVRCFDLRIRFNKKRELQVAHGIVVYDISEMILYRVLNWINSQEEKCYVRILHEVRNKRQRTQLSKELFINFCSNVVERYPNITFFDGHELSEWTYEYNFPYKPNMVERYSSVCKPFYDLPKCYAMRNNKELKENPPECDILLLDYVNVP